MNWLMKPLVISFSIIMNFAICAEPMVMIDLPGLLGNRLFGYCMAKIIAEEMGGWKVHSKSIWGFPDTYFCPYNTISQEYATQIVLESPPHFFDFKEILRNKQKRNIKLEGYFISYEPLKKYKNIIRNEWLKIDPELRTSYPNHEAIVVHVRAEFPDCYFIPFEFYEQALASASYDQVYICTDNPNHPFLRNFDKYNPIIVSTRNISHTLCVEERSWDEIASLDLDDFLFILSFDKIVCGVSTYSWWAAFLSNAKEIYAPYDEKFKYLKVDEDRYHYIPINIGR